MMLQLLPQLQLVSLEPRLGLAIDSLDTPQVASTNT